MLIYEKKLGHKSTLRFDGKYRTRVLREIYAKDFSAGIEGSCVDVAVHVALRGLIDLLFFSYGVTMLALILIEFLLRSTIR